MSLTSPDDIKEVVERVAANATELAKEIIKAQLGPSGEAYGAIPAQGAEFVAMYLDWNHRIWTEVTTPDGQVIPIPPTPIRLLDEIEVKAPRFAERAQRQFEREAQKLLEVA